VFVSLAERPIIAAGHSTVSVQNPVPTLPESKGNHRQPGNRVVQVIGFVRGFPIQREISNLGFAPIGEHLTKLSPSAQTITQKQAQQAHVK